MICSMTGFGQAEGQVLNRNVTVELRSVNNRFKDIVVRMPKSYSAIEDRIKKLIAEKVSRGRIDVWIQVDDSELKQERLVLDLELARTYHSMLKKLQDELGLTGDVTLANLTDFRDIIRHEEEQLDLEAFMDGMEGIIGEALDRLSSMRQKECVAIALDFQDRLSRMMGWLEDIEAGRATVIQDARTKLETRIQALTEGIELDQARLHQEVAFIIDRADITEEIVRLKSHFGQFGSLLKKDGPAGRKLEFLLQEMNREVNTIGSKSSDLTITNRVVDLKAELEKLREQVLNIE